MSDQHPPSSRNRGDIRISGGTFSGDVVSFGHGSHISIVKSVYEDGKPTIDMDGLKQMLLELHKSLEGAPLCSRRATCSARHAACCNNAQTGRAA
jgi:hypothetical protein